MSTLFGFVILGLIAAAVLGYMAWKIVFLTFFVIAVSAFAYGYFRAKL